MFTDHASRLNREDWGSHVTQQTDFLQSLAQGLAALRDAMGEQGSRISLPHESLPQVQPVVASGVTMLGQELSLMLGKSMPLTQRAPLTVEVTQPTGATTPALQVNARSNDPNADPIAIDTNGLIYQNGVPIGTGGGGASPTGLIAMWSGSAASIPAGWALMNGVDNAAGTGLNLLNCFVKFGSVFDGPNGSTDTGMESPNVTITGSTGSASPGGSCTGTTDLNGAGDTSDETPALTGNTGVAVSGVTVATTGSGTTAAGSGNTGTASPTGTVSGTLANAVTGISIGSHSGSTTSASTTNHSHNVSLGFEVQGGSGTGYYGHNASTVVSSSTNIDSHTHTFSGLTHSITEPNSGTGHTHSMSGVSVTLSSHDHTIGSHTHTFTGTYVSTVTEPAAGAGHSHSYGTLAVAAHHHTVSDHAHTFTGTISVASHSHGVGTLTGTVDSHSHTPGEPAHVVLLPIEKLP